MTVQQLFDKVWNRHWSLPRYTASGWAAEVLKYWEKNLRPTFGQIPVTSVTRGQIREWLDGFESRPFAGNRSLEVLSKLFTYAEEREWVPAGFNPCRSVKSFPERKRSRYATAAELAVIGALLADSEERAPRCVAFVRLVALTGARPTSIARARRDQLTLLPDGSGVLRFDGKTTAETGEEECVIFPPEALAVVQGLPVRVDGLIVGHVPYRSFWDTLCKRAGIEKLWLRDLRRTFATVGFSSGVAKDVVGGLLNHRNSKTTDLYAKLLPTTRVTAAGAIAVEMSRLMGVA